MEMITVITIIITGIAAVYLLNQWWEGRYVEQWKQAAAALGLPYRANAADLLGRYRRLATLNRGRDQRIANAIIGDVGDLKICVVDFRHTTGSGKSTQHHKETLCLVEAEALSVPRCSLRPQVAVFDFLGKLFGGQDIDFADDPEFSRCYVLQGDDAEAVRQVFDAPIRAWFVQRRKSNLNFEANGSVLVFHNRKKLPPERCKELMADALEIKELLVARQVMG